ncbi:MAG TPA: universal stress protein [Dermatophilaceae bacterium]
MVVGSGGRRGFAELLLGSIADQVVRCSRCPVTVVRAKV